MLDLTECYEREFECCSRPFEQPEFPLSEVENKNVSKTARTQFYRFQREFLREQNPAAAYGLGLFYRYRRPCGEWLLRTLEYWTFAAMMGEWRAAFFLYQMFHCGEGEQIPEDPERAFAWLLKCYESNPAPNIGNLLARRYLSGNGTERDARKAQACYLRGAEQGDVWSLHELKTLTEALDDPSLGLDLDAVEAHCRRELFRSCGVKFRDE